MTTTDRPITRSDLEEALRPLAAKVEEGFRAMAAEIKRMDGRLNDMAGMVDDLAGRMDETDSKLDTIIKAVTGGYNPGVNT